MNKSVNSVYVKDGTQERMILDYIKVHGKMTAWDAFVRLGISQPAARIWGLKRRGINIKTRPITIIDSYGNNKRVVEYFLGDK